MPFGPLLAWKRGDVLGVAQRLYAAFGGAVLAMLVMLLFVDGASVFAALGVGLAAWLVLGALTDLATKSGIGNGARPAWRCAASSACRARCSARRSPISDSG